MFKLNGQLQFKTLCDCTNLRIDNRIEAWQLTASYLNNYKLHVLREI